MAASSSQRSLRYEMGQTTRSEWENDMRAHRELLRNVIEEHREGRDGSMDWGDMIRELEYEEEKVYPDTSALGSSNPPSIVKGASGWIYHSTSLGCLKPYHFPRRLAINVVESAVFDPFILTTIMLNCSTMAWSSPLDPPGTAKQDFLAVMEWVFLYIFTFELTMKIIAYGFFFHKHSYLRDAWCQLDFVIVSLAWLPILFPAFFGNMSAIRSVRALRPLRALKRVPGMPVLVSSILQSMPALGNVGGLAGFIFLIFGIIGMNLFKGVLHYRCADSGVPAGDAHQRMLMFSPEVQLSNEAFVMADTAGSVAAGLAFRRLLEGDYAGASAYDLHNDSHRRRRRLKGGGGYQGGGDDPQSDFDSGTFCAADTEICVEEGQSCFYFDNNPDGGTVSFDSVSAAMIPIIMAITFDTWTDPMFDVMDAYAYSSWVYFIAIAVLGGMFVVNLFLAVIFDEFMRAQASDEAEKEVMQGAPAEDPYGIDENETAAMIKAGKDMSDGKAKELPSICDCAPSGGWRQGLKGAMLSELSNNISTGFVVFNLVVMCMPYAGQPESWANLVEGLSSFVTWVFIVEMGLKLLGYGCHYYWSDSWNTLDGVIVSLSIVEMLITILLADTGINISFLRMLRLLRLLRLLKAWPGLYKIVMSFVKAIPQISNLFILMFLVQFIFALLGMQTFGGTGVGEDSRWHFDYFYTAMLTTFGIFTGGWVDAFQVCADIVGIGVSVAYFMPGLVIGFFIIMNLFIAILLEAFADDEEEEGEGEGEEEAETTAPATPAAPLLPAGTDEPAKELEPLEGISIFCLPPDNGFRKFCQWLAEHKNFDSFIIVLIIASSIALALDVPRLSPDSDLHYYLVVTNYWFTGLFIVEMLLKMVAYGIAFTPNAYLKSGWNVLDFTIVMISILGLFAELVPAFGRLKALRILRVLRPLRLLQRNPGMKLIISSLIQTLPSVVEVLAVVMVFHVVFAILGMQLFSGQFGSCTDETITTRTECVPHMSAEPRPIAERRFLLGASSLLPLEPLNATHKTTYPLVSAMLQDGWTTRAETDRVTLSNHALERSPPPLTSASASSTRGAIGRQLHQKRKELGRRSRRRFDGNAGEGSELARHERQLDDLPTEWLNPAFGSFDDFASSMLILYVASTGDGWEEFMWAGMDATGVDVAPERNDFSPASIFFLMWMIVGSFVALNLFVGAIVDNFTRIKQESDGSATMTPEQQQWVATLKETVNNKAQKAPKEPKWGPRKAAFRLIQTRSFDFTVIGVIMLNVLGMALDYHRIEDSEQYFYYYTNGMMFFTYFYYCECVMKLFGLGLTYFSDPWCRFDFFLVFVAFMDQFFSELLASLLPMPPTILRVLRVARVLRMLRLLKNLKGLRDLVMTLVFSAPALMNVGALLCLVIFMYAVLGVNLFTFVQPGEDLNGEGRNFVTFGNACLLLFQCLTGDGWSAIMDDAMINEERGCSPAPADGSPSDCGTSLALPYFLSFTVIGTFVMLNLVVAVILENFTSLGNVNPDLVSTNDIEEFKEQWGYYDPDADGMIPAKMLPELILSLTPPLGIKGTKDGTTPSKAFRFCLSLGLTQKNGEVGFKQVLDALIQKNYSAKKVQVAGGGALTESPPAVREVLMMRQKTIGSLDISKVTPAGLNAPLTERRFEMSRILAEELLRMFIRRKRESWVNNPESHPSYRKQAETTAAVSKAHARGSQPGAPGAGKLPQSGGKGGAPPKKAGPNGSKKKGGLDA